jgi:hypothetical protein
LLLFHGTPSYKGKVEAGVATFRKNRSEGSRFRLAIGLLAQEFLKFLFG